MLAGRSVMDSVMDIDTEIYKGLSDFNVVIGDEHKGAREEGGISCLNLGLIQLTWRPCNFFIQLFLLKVVWYTCLQHGVYCMMMVHCDVVDCFRWHW